MRWHRYVLELLSGAATPWQADTLIGHFAWDIVHREGEAALGDFLAAFAAGRPPFVLSDGCPGDLLPAPMSLPWLYAETEASRAAAGHKWLTLDEFNAVRAGHAPSHLPQTARREPWRTVAVPHVALSRSTFTSGEGSLQSREERFPLDADGRRAPVSFYALVEDHAAADRLRDLFARLSASGYGKKKSSGSGAFRLAGAGPFNGFTEVHTDGVVTLANTVPAADDPTEGLWQTGVKYGRLGEERALRPQPFKRPFQFLCAGAVFRVSPRKSSSSLPGEGATCGTSPSTLAGEGGGGGTVAGISASRPWLGRTLRGLSTDPTDPGRQGDDVQVCLTPVLPCVWPAALDKHRRV